MELIEQARPFLRGFPQHQVFVGLGVGDFVGAIEATLSILLDAEQSLPDLLMLKLELWLDNYAGNPVQARLREILASLHRIARTGCDDPPILSGHPDKAG